MGSYAFSIFYGTLTLNGWFEGMSNLVLLDPALSIPKL